jgi:phytoene synthase
MIELSLLEILPPPQRLALAYAPARFRPHFLAFFALDTRLATLVRGASEPMLGQLRLAWWRDRLTEDSGKWPSGEPVLEALQSWQGGHGVLGQMVDGWELMLDDAPLSPAALSHHAQARAAGFSALAGLVGSDAAAQDAHRMGCNWALADLASHLGDPAETAAVLELALLQDWKQTRLPRALRPLAVLHGMAGQAMKRDLTGGLATRPAILAAIRLGLLGR